MPKFNRRLAIQLAKLAILILVVWGGHQTIASALTDLEKQNWKFSDLRPAWAVLSGVLYLISQLPAGWFWHRVLAALGQSVDLLHALRAYYIGHLGKYVPGKAMVVFLRAALVGKPHVKTSLAVVAVFYETFTTMAVGAVLAAIVALAAAREHAWLIVGTLALAIVVGLPTLPPVFARILKMMKITAAVPSTAVINAEKNPIHLRLSLLVSGWLAIALGWFFAGASLWATVRAIGVDDPLSFSNLVVYTATVALAVVLGFVSMLPAGVGVRDIALMQFLVPYLSSIAHGKGEALALVAVIVLRLIWLVAEAILAAVLYPLGRKAKETTAAA